MFAVKQPKNRSAAFSSGRNTVGSFAARPVGARGSSKGSSTTALFGVGNDGENDIFIALDFEIEAPIPCYPALPYVERLAVFFRVQGRMAAIGEQEAQLFAERL